MALADTAKLVVDLSLKGNFASQIAADKRALSGFDRAITSSQGRAYKAGQQIGVGIRRGVILGVTALGTLSGVLIRIAKEGQEAAKVENIFANAIKNSGKVTVAQVAALKAQEEALLALGGVDDELIKTEQTRLIQMGLTGAQVEKLTPLVLDFAKATGLDLLTATKLAGKATQGNTTALSRYGVMIDKTKAKVDPFAATVDALNGKFGGTTKALSGGLDVRLAVLREKLANLREEAGIKLLPVFTRIVDVVGSKLVPAFGKLIDAVLPKVITGLEKLAGWLDRGGATDSINALLGTIQTLVPAIVSGAEITGKVISTAVNLFKSLPPEIQGLAVAGFAVNKLTGGLVTNIAGGLISAVISSFKGLMNVNAAVVNVNGPVAGIPGAAAGAGAATGIRGKVGGIVSAVGKVFLVGAAIGAFAELKGILDEQSQQNRELTTAFTEQTRQFTGGATLAQLKAGLASVDDSVRNQSIAERAAFNLNIGGVKDTIADTRAKLVAAIQKEQNRLVSASERTKDDVVHAVAFGAKSTRDKIEAAKVAQVSALTKVARAAKYAGQQAAAAIKDKDLSVSLTSKTVVNAGFDIRTVIGGATTIRRYGNATTSISTKSSLTNIPS